MSDEFPLVVRHLSCGGIAFHARRKLVSGEAVFARDFRHVDGRPMIEGEVAICDACGKTAWLSEKDIRFE